MNGRISDASLLFFRLGASLERHAISMETRVSWAWSCAFATACLLVVFFAVESPPSLSGLDSVVFLYIFGMVWASYIFLTVVAVVVVLVVVVVVLVSVVDDIILGISFMRKHPKFQSTNSFLYKKFYHSPPWVLIFRHRYRIILRDRL
jgi:hypothetical protein